MTDHTRHDTNDQQPDAGNEVMSPTLDERARRLEHEILNTYTVERDTSLADGAGAPGSTSAGNNRAGLPDADRRRGERE